MVVWRGKRFIFCIFVKLIATRYHSLTFMLLWQINYDKLLLWCCCVKSESYSATHNRIISKYLILIVKKYFIKKLLICCCLIWRNVAGCSWRSQWPAVITWLVSFQKTMRMIWWFWWAVSPPHLTDIEWLGPAGWEPRRHLARRTVGVWARHTPATTRHCNTALSLWIIRE